MQIFKPVLSIQKVQYCSFPYCSVNSKENKFFCSSRLQKYIELINIIIVLALGV